MPARNRQLGSQGVGAYLIAVLVPNHPGIPFDITPESPSRSGEFPSAVLPQPRAQDKDRGGKTERCEITATIALKVAATLPLEEMPVDRERYSTPPWPC